MKKWHWFLLSLVVIIADQATKHWASVDLVPYQPKSLLPMLNLTLAYNSGAAFSFLSGAGEWHRWFFPAFSFVMCVLLSIWVLRMELVERLQLLAVSLILGGAIGNLIDRAFTGYVIDFIDVYYQHYHWPVFNLADSAICIGAFLLFVDLIKNKSSAA